MTQFHAFLYESKAKSFDIATLDSFMNEQHRDFLTVRKISLSHASRTLEGCKISNLLVFFSSLCNWPAAKFERGARGARTGLPGWPFRGQI